LYILASLLLLWMKVMKLIFLCPDFKLNIISEEWKILKGDFNSQIYQWNSNTIYFDYFFFFLIAS
jgi:hypothetical protein